MCIRDSSQTLLQSFYNLLHLQNCSYLSNLFGSTHPFACIWDFLTAYLVHYKSIVLIFLETNAIKYLSHPHSWHEILTRWPTYWIFLPDSSQFVSCCYNHWQSLFTSVCHLIIQAYVLQQDLNERRFLLAAWVSIGMKITEMNVLIELNEITYRNFRAITHG